MLKRFRELLSDTRGHYSGTVPKISQRTYIAVPEHYIQKLATWPRLCV